MLEYSLPLVTFYLTERCNSRCVTCDYWRHGKRDASLESVRRVLPDLRRLHTRLALLSGGEPLMNPEWQAIAESLRGAGLEVWLLTSGLSLAKLARPAAASCDMITVSLDGTNAATYRAIRGLDAFDKVCEGVRAAVAQNAVVSLRVTLQKSNYQELPRFVALAHDLGVRQVSFLAVDVANSHAFARSTPVAEGLALSPDDLPRMAQLIDALERDCAADFDSGFIAESPTRLRRIHQYFAALQGVRAYPAVHCNAPEFSAVIGADGRVAPCFFIPGTGASTRTGLVEALADAALSELRVSIRAGRRPECQRCVCSKWFDPATSAFEGFMPEVSRHA